MDPAYRIMEEQGDMMNDRIMRHAKRRMRFDSDRMAQDEQYNLRTGYRKFANVNAVWRRRKNRMRYGQYIDTSKDTRAEGSKEPSTTDTSIPAASLGTMAAKAQVPKEHGEEDKERKEDKEGKEDKEDKEDKEAELEDAGEHAVALLAVAYMHSDDGDADLAKFEKESQAHPGDQELLQSGYGMMGGHGKMGRTQTQGSFHNRMEQRMRQEPGDKRASIDAHMQAMAQRGARTSSGQQWAHNRMRKMRRRRTHNRLSRGERAMAHHNDRVAMGHYTPGSINSSQRHTEWMHARHKVMPAFLVTPMAPCLAATGGSSQAMLARCALLVQPAVLTVVPTLLRLPGHQAAAPDHGPRPLPARGPQGDQEDVHQLLGRGPLPCSALCPRAHRVSTLLPAPPLPSPFVSG